MPLFIDRLPFHHWVDATRSPPLSYWTVVLPVIVASPAPYRMVLHRGLPFHDSPILPDPHFQRPLIGIRGLRNAGLKVEIDFLQDTISVWTPDP